MQPIQIRYPRSSYLVPLPFIVLLPSLILYFVFWGPEPHGLLLKGIAIGLSLICACFFIYFLKQAIARPYILLMNGEGFEYRPNGVSTGFISWNEVERAGEVKVLSSGASIIGRYERALGVWLKEPEIYFQRWRQPLRSLMRINAQRYGATLLIEPASIGKRYEEVRSAFVQRVGELEAVRSKRQ